MLAMPLADNHCHFRVALRQQLLVAAADVTRAAARCRHVGATLALSSSAQRQKDLSTLNITLTCAESELGQHPPFGSWQHGQNVLNKLQW